jgi:uncharacterized protein (TIGR02453 family)
MAAKPLLLKNRYIGNAGEPFHQLSFDRHLVNYRGPSVHAHGFRGFSPAAIQFLRALKRNNRREWFQPRKHQFEQLLKAPMLELVALVNRELVRFAPQYVTDPKKAVFRIYRDTRFSADKSPYKTQIAAIFTRRGPKELGMGGLYFSVSAETVEVAGGIYHPPRETLLMVRSHIREHHAELERIVRAPKTRKLLGDLQGDTLTRIPKGFSADHPSARFVKMKDWIFDVTLEASRATKPSLVPDIVERFRAMQPLVEFLNRPLLARKPFKGLREDYW